MTLFRGICLLLIVSIVQLTKCNKDIIDVQKLLAQMNEQEKCGQMTQVSFEAVQKDAAFLKPDENPIDMDKLRIAINDFKVGSILNTPAGVAQSAQTWQAIIETIQDVALNETRLSIPVLYGLDSIHGANYIQEGVLFPQPLNLGSTFNATLVERIAEITAVETRAIGIPWNFNPVLDVGRQSAWPRLYETFGEDVHLAMKLGEAYIKGQQGDDLKNRKKVATCLKHYIGYSFPFNGLDRTVAWIPENLLREIFLPPFEACIKAGSPTVMINSGDVNGLPGHANYHYLTTILKGELNFTGFAVSDWEDVKRLHTRDRLAETPEDAVRLAIMSGVDMSMVPYDFSFAEHCVNIWRKGDVHFRSRVDDAVARILMVKKKLGLFENSYPVKEDLNEIGSMESEDINLVAARESLILAQNDGILPLKNNGQKILVTGPTANLIKVLNGGWSYNWLGDREDLYENFGRKKYTVLQALRTRSDNVEYHEGADFQNLKDFDETIEAAKSSDLIILCLGEATYTETPGNVNNMMISEAQSELSHALLATEKPLIVVYLGGRPRIITGIATKANAVVLAFLPGNQGAIAIADLIYGTFNPSGRLSISYPSGPNSITTYDKKSLEDYSYTVGMDVKNGFSPLYEFGHGLSYTQFEYSNLTLASHQVFQKESAYGSVTVRNVGSLEGQEVVMVYLNDDYASLTRPKKQLKFFKKVNLKPNEAVTVHFEISHYDMSFIDMDNKRIVEPGRFNIYVQNLNVSFFLKSDSYDVRMPYLKTQNKSVKNSVKNSGFSIMPAKFVVLSVLAVVIANIKKIT